MSRIPVHKVRPLLSNTAQKSIYLAVFAASLCFILHLGAQQVGSLQANAITLSVTHARIDSFQSDHVELTVETTLTPSVAATLNDIRFDGVKIDGQTPVYIRPVEGESVLKPGIPLQLPALRMSVYYSDFPSPSRMEETLDAKSFHLTGHARAGLKLSFFGKLAIRDSHPTAAFDLNQDVPLDHDAVDAPTQLGVGLLSFAQKVLGGSASIVERVTNVRITHEDSAADPVDAQSTVIVRTSYNLRKNGQPIRKTLVRLGFWIEENQVLTTADALRPWEFSSEIAGMLASGEATLEESSVETKIFPAAKDAGETEASYGAGWSFREDEFSVARKGNPQRIKLVLATGRTVSILDSASQGNFAILQSHKQKGTAVSKNAPSNANASGHLLRWWTNDRGNFLQELQIQSGPSATTLPRPMDESAFGSPVFVENEAIGMVLSQDVILPVSTIQKH